MALVRFPVMLMAALGGVALLVASCAKGPVPPCPSVRVDDTTARLTKFREGAGRDVTDVEYDARVAGYKGECVFHDNGVDVVMDLDFTVAGGPAAKAGPVSLYYFVAIPQFFPQADGKQIFEAKAKLPGRAAVRERIQERGVKVFIPLKKDEPAASYDVYVGLQLTNEQLQYNRSLSR